MEKPHLVAVYGSLLSGLGNHRVLHRLGEEHFKFVGKTETEPNLTLFSLGGFPGVHENGMTSVKIEVYQVSTELLEGPLDRLEGYHKDHPEHSMYIRKQIPTEFGDAWIYIYNSNTTHPAIEDGDWKKYLQNK